MTIKKTQKKNGKMKLVFGVREWIPGSDSPVDAFPLYSFYCITCSKQTGQSLSYPRIEIWSVLGCWKQTKKVLFCMQLYKQSMDQFPANLYRCTRLSCTAFFLCLQLLLSDKHILGQWWQVCKAERIFRTGLENCWAEVHLSFSNAWNQVGLELIL